MNKFSISSGYADQEKLKKLEEIKDIVFQVEIIKSLVSDELKIFLMHKMTLNDYFKAQIITSIQSEKNKINQMHQQISSLGNHHKANIIKTLSSDEIKIREMKKANIQGPYRVEIIKSLSSDDLKIKYLKKILVLEYQIEIITSLSSDFKKISLLKKLNITDKERMNIIKSLSDSFKIAYLDKISTNSTKLVIIDSIKDLKLRNNLISELLEKLRKRENKRLYNTIGLDENLTIGVEIESEGANYNDIRLNDWYGWSSKPDSTLVCGVEVISPIMHDCSKNINELYNICNLLVHSKQSITKRCGGHVHIGADYLTSKKAYANLLEIWSNSEALLYLIGNTVKTLPRQMVLNYAESISPKISHFSDKLSVNIENDSQLDEFVAEVKKIQGERYSSINFLNITDEISLNNGHNNIEFRLSNGTLDANVWIENIRLYGRIVEVSEKMTHQPELEKLKEKLKEPLIPFEKLEILLTLLFSPQEQKVYRKRYYQNLKLISELSPQDNPLIKAKFNHVDFSQKKKII